MRVLVAKALNRGYVLSPLAAPRHRTGGAGLSKALQTVTSTDPSLPETRTTGIDEYMTGLAAFALVVPGSASLCLVVGGFLGELIPALALADPGAHPPAAALGRGLRGMGEGTELLVGVKPAAPDSRPVAV